MVEDLDPVDYPRGEAECLAHLEAILEDFEPGKFANGLAALVRAFGGIEALAARMEVSAADLEAALATGSEIEFGWVLNIMRGMGFKLMVMPISKKRLKRKRPRLKKKKPRFGKRG